MANEIKDGEDTSKKDLQNNEDVEDTDILDDEDDTESNDSDGKEDKKEEKPTETLEAKQARLQRQLDRVNKKLGKDKEEEKSDKSDELGYGEKAFLVASGIKGTEEMDLVKQIAKETGKSLESVIESKYFQAELKEMRELKTSKDAQLKTNRRGNDSSKDTVDYWLAKGELPPSDQRELRQKVVNARMKNEGSGSPFTKNPIA